MKLSVVIVNYNVKYYLEQCLMSVFQSTLKNDMEVFVVDNNSTDGSIDYLRLRFPDVKYICNVENMGFARANNVAIRQSSGEYVLLLNPDTMVAEDTFEKCCEAMDANGRVGGLGVKMINAHGHFLPESKRGLPTPWVSVCKLFGLNKLFPKSHLFGRYYMRYLDDNESHEVEVLAGAFMMLRRSTLDAVGLLDEAFFMYGEDIDLSYRIIKAGFLNLYLPIKILHYKGESAYRYNPYYVKVFYSAMVIFFKKHFVHYSRFFTIAVKFGIVVCGFFVFLRKSIFCLLPRDFFRKRQRVIVNLSNETYNDAIARVEHIGQEYANADCFVYHPQTDIAVGSDEVLTHYQH
jgi:GT2 family glycosyltransferase